MYVDIKKIEASYTVDNLDVSPIMHMESTPGIKYT